jgi:hypothetical protein
VRFFAHDGNAVHGPAVIDELLKLPGFDGDTLVCPVGSENSADWKPALAYPPFRVALLAAAPKLTPLSAPPPLALPCPLCGRGNPEDARFCNACAARMDGSVEPPAPAPVPAASPEPAPEPVSEPPAFMDSDPLAPLPQSSPDLVEPGPSEPAPEPAAPTISTWRKPLIASFLGATLASGGLGWWLLRPAKRVVPSPVDLIQPAPASPGPASPAPPAAPAATASPAPVPPAPPLAPKPAARADLNDLTKAPPPAAAKRARRKARAPKPAPEAAPKAEETLIESHAASGEPSMPGGAPAAAPAEDRGVLLPGVPRRVPPQSVTKPKAGAPAGAAAASPEAGEDGPTKQVREQFVFCAQLLAQEAFADHFDTCLCADARQAAPYRGRRGFYATAMKKASAAGTLETSAAIKSIVLNGPIAKVTADWKSGATEKPRTETETWQLEDGLWCRFP